MSVPRGFDADAVHAALSAGHGSDCQEPDEDGPGSCVCEQADLSRALAEAAEIEGRYEP